LNKIIFKANDCESNFAPSSLLHESSWHGESHHSPSNYEAIDEKESPLPSIIYVPNVNLLSQSNEIMQSKSQNSLQIQQNRQKMNHLDELKLEDLNWQHGHLQEVQQDSIEIEGRDKENANLAVINSFSYAQVGQNELSSLKNATKGRPIVKRVKRSYFQTHYYLFIRFFNDFI
jgi:hypothetical protein